jgi:hypothetical protein
MSHAHLYGKSEPYQHSNNINPRSRVNESGGNYKNLRDSRIIADKAELQRINYEEKARMAVLNDSIIPRELTTMNTFKVYPVYHDISHRNASLSNGDDFYLFEVNSSFMSSGGAKSHNSCAVTKLEIGLLKMPIYLSDIGYNLTEIFVNIRNLTQTYNNGAFHYQFKMYPGPALSFSDPIKYHYIADISEFDLDSPQNLDVIELELRDKTSKIQIPYPRNNAVLTIGPVTIFTARNHGLINGFLVSLIKCSFYNLPAIFTRLHPITVIDADTFSMAIDSSIWPYLNDGKCEYFVDNFNFELNIKLHNVNWDTNAITSGRK